MNEVAAAKFFRRQANFSGNSVHVPFQSEDALRRTKPAKGSVRRDVGRHRLAPDANVRAKVWTSRVNRAAREHYRRKRAVGAPIDHEIDFHRQEFSVFRNCGFMTRARWMTLRRGDHVFGAVIDHLDRPARFARQQGRVPGDHRGVFFLPAKAATGFSLNHAHLFFRPAKQLDQGLMHIIRTLHRSPDRHAIFWISNRNRPVVFNIELLLRAGFIFAFDNEVCLCPRIVDVAFINQEFFEDVVFAPDDFFLRQRILQRKNRRQLFIINPNVAAPALHYPQ